MLDLQTLDSIFASREIPPSIRIKIEELRSSEYFNLFDSSGYQALLSIILYALENGWTEEQINKLLFNPVKPSKDQVEIFRQRHEAIYAQQALGLAQDVDQSVGQFFSITSAMYAGKSTLAAEVCSNLSELGYRVIPIVPSFMVESDEEDEESGDSNGIVEKKAFITLRGRKEREGEIVGPDGFTRIEALPYSTENYLAFFESLNISPTDKVVIHFDEFSFMGTEDILLFRNYVQQNYPNVKVLFVGLNKNALGQDLAGYLAVQNNVEREIPCRSFVPNILQDIDELCEPTGTYTSRYVVLPSGMHVLDCGFLPVVVTKEFARLVYYTPSNMEHHMHYILQQIDQDALLDSIVNPSEDQQSIRSNLFHTLRSAPVATEA